MEPAFFAKKPDRDELPLFAAARASDPETSHEAAERITGKLSQLQQQVLTAYATFGKVGATAREVETMRRFEGLAPSTVRCRITELHKIGRLEAIGKRDGLTVYVFVPEGAR